MNPALVYLTQTDTTAGFLSQNEKKLKKIKNRVDKKRFIISVDSLKTLKTFTRVPRADKKMIRRAKKTTIVYPNNQAIRVVKDKNHLRFLKKVRWAYSTSSNRAGCEFEESFAKKSADVIIYDKYGFSEKKSSMIIKCGKITKRRLR